MKACLQTTVASAFVLVLICFVSGCAPGGQGGGAAGGADKGRYLTRINPAFMVTPEEAYAWHALKDRGGPTYSGNASWQAYMAFLEKKLAACGVVDLVKNKWTYNRWSTSDWPDDSRWGLVSDGAPVKAAHYGAYSGATGPAGITAPLAVYDPQAPAESFKGKILVFKTLPHPRPPLDDEYKKWFTLNDYEYRDPDGGFPPLFTPVPPSETVSFDVWWQLRQTAMVHRILNQTGAAGGVVVFDMSYRRLAGLYTFPVMPAYHAPNLYVDRVAGAKVLKDAMAGKTATLRLEAEVTPTETYQLIGFLPGRDYGTARDEQIMLVSHTDGPAVLQDNGALGVLAIVAYFSHIPQAERPRTLMVYLDNRHYMPGMEAAFAKQDWLARNPDAKKRIVALVATEHLGQIEFREAGGDYAPTGRVEPAFLWTRNDQRLIDMAVAAVKAHSWPRVMVQCVERPGRNGGPQGIWYGMGKLALDLNLPAYGMMGTQGAYWATTARIDTFDPLHFCTEAAVMSRLTGELMQMRFRP
jgi:hypothetical protein